ncbi:glycosyltransferase [Christensenellaceae bacterium OttesenSCG-928-K19]|nr:glycosyltransferase [Christensenellaceae bacterium OttesenSCG-928-K19]
MLETIVYYLNVFFFVYMFLYALVFFTTTLTASLRLDDFFVRKRYMSYAMLSNDRNYIPVSILVPAFNEEITIIDTVESLLNLKYTEYEIVVINDGSEDNTSQVLIDRFGLKQVARPARLSVPCNEIINVYENMDKVRITLVNKKNGGKADALNAGINICRFPLFACIDADSMLQDDSIRIVAEPFLENDDTIAVGGNIKISNDVIIENGQVVETNIPKKPIILFQMIEYLRVFLASRVALNSINGNLIISGAFGLYKKAAAINVGGYTPGVIGEDMEIIVKMHAFYRKNKIPYMIYYAPDAICWTQAPEKLSVLRRQRRRWHEGMGQSLGSHMFMFFNPHYGTVGTVAFPYFVLFEYITPILEVAGIVTIVLSYFLGLLNVQFFIMYLLIYMGFSMIVSLISLLLDRYIFPTHSTPRLTAKLVLFAFLESFGYRQFCSLCRLGAFIGFNKNQWGKMERTQNRKREDQPEES